MDSTNLWVLQLPYIIVEAAHCGNAQKRYQNTLSYFLPSQKWTDAYSTMCIERKSYFLEVEKFCQEILLNIAHTIDLAS